VRRNSDGHLDGLGGFEQPPEIRDRVVLCNALAEDRPSSAAGAQEVVLRVDHDQRRPRALEHEPGVR
jgi:hypothetical protein